jgi:cell division protein FtsB
MNTYAPTRPAQTLYVNIRRDELAQLKQDRERLQAQVEHLQQQLLALHAPMSPELQARAALN